MSTFALWYQYPYWWFCNSHLSEPRISLLIVSLISPLNSFLIIAYFRHEFSLSELFVTYNRNVSMFPFQLSYSPCNIVSAVMIFGPYQDPFPLVRISTLLSSCIWYLHLPIEIIWFFILFTPLQRTSNLCLVSYNWVKQLSAYAVLHLCSGTLLENMTAVLTDFPLIVMSLKYALKGQLKRPHLRKSNDHIWAKVKLVCLTRKKGCMENWQICYGAASLTLLCSFGRCHEWIWKQGWLPRRCWHGLGKVVRTLNIHQEWIRPSQKNERTSVGLIREMGTEFTYDPELIPL